jgi:DNA-binding response OmpR family regulator
MQLLLLEDDPRFGALLCDHLRAAGFTATLAASVAEFEAFAARSRQDLYLIDLGLPDGDGLDVISRARARRQSTPVLIITSRSAVRERVLGLERGADDYLTKPFNIAELLARVRALLRRAPVLNDARLQAGELVLDCGTGEISCSGSPVDLSPSERRVLELLIRRAGKVVPKDLINDVVQGACADRTPNATEQLISRLRKSLSNRATDIELRTIRGLGYVLEARRT